MLKITILNENQATTLLLEGRLAGPWVGELERVWQEARTGPEATKVKILLSEVSYIDAAGKELLTRMYHEGVELTGTGCMTRAVVADIRGEKPGWYHPGVGGFPKKLLSIAIWVGLLVFAPLLRAQDKPPLELSLREAIALALKQNPQVRIAVLNTAQSQQEQVIARSALLPQATLEVSDAVRRINLGALLGQSVPGFPHHGGPFQIFQAGPQFSTPVFDLTLWRRLQAARQNVRGNEAQAQFVREQTILLVVSQYIGALRSAADVRAAQSRVDLAQALYDQASDLQKTGVGTGIDTLRANVQLQNEKQRLLVSETQLKTTVYGLVRLLNLDPRQTVALADQLSFEQTQEWNPNEILDRALAERPEMKALIAREHAARFQKGAASASRVPSFRVIGNWAYNGTRLNNGIPTYEYQAVADLPLFTAGRIRAQVREADLELKKIAQQRDDLRNQIALEIKTAAADLASARNEVDVANLGVKLSEEEVSQARDRFQAGVANNIEVITAQDALSRANDNQIAALYRYNQARADLAHAIGQMESLYAK